MPVPGDDPANPFAGVWIELERCTDCHSHEYCTRHIEAKYQQYESQVAQILDTKIPPGKPYKFVCNPGPKSHGVNCKRSDYNPYMYASYSMDQNTRKWFQTTVFRYPRIGGFEIYINKGKTRRQVFSKLQDMKWPNPQWVVDKIVEAVDQIGGWEPVQLQPKKKVEYAGVKGKMEVSDDELRQLMKKKFCTLLAAFKSFDKNGDGCVNRKEFGIGMKNAGVDLPPKVVDRIWQMADSDGTGALAYQEFARKFAAYKATSSLHREVGFKSKSDEEAEKLHGTGAGTRVSKHSTIREKAVDTFRVDPENFNADKKEQKGMTIQEIARGGDLSQRDIEQMTPDEIRALCVQRHGNLMVAFRHLAIDSNDFKVDYNDFMKRFAHVVGKPVSALKLNEIWRTMDGDFSGVIELSEFSSNKCLCNTDAHVTALKGNANVPSVREITQNGKKPDDNQEGVHNNQGAHTLTQENVVALAKDNKPRPDSASTAAGTNFTASTTVVRPVSAYSLPSVSETHVQSGNVGMDSATNVDPYNANVGLNTNGTTQSGGLNVEMMNGSMNGRNMNGTLDTSSNMPLNSTQAPSGLNGTLATTEDDPYADEEFAKESGSDNNNQ